MLQRRIIIFVVMTILAIYFTYTVGFSFSHPENISLAMLICWTASGVTAVLTAIELKDRPVLYWLVGTMGAGISIFSMLLWLECAFLAQVGR